VEGDGDEDYRKLKSAIMSPRPVLMINRGRGGGGSGGGSVSITQRSSVNSNFAAPTGAYVKMSNMGSERVKGQRVSEKKDLQDLNTRLADYIEKVRFLEAQNRKLTCEVEEFRERWGKETQSIKEMYEKELEEARKLLNESEKDKCEFEIKYSSAEDEVKDLKAKLADERQNVNDYKEQTNKLQHQLSDYEAEINLMRRRIANYERESIKDKDTIKRLSEDLKRCRADLDNETLNRVIAENEKQSLEEELEFLKQVHEQEMKELAALAYRDSTAENREYWKNELSQAVHEIQQEYDGKLDQMRYDLDTYYEAKINEFGAGQTRSNMETTHAKEQVRKYRADLTDLRAKIADLEARNACNEKKVADLTRELEEKERDFHAEKCELEDNVQKLTIELEQVLAQLQTLFDAKMSLELEIAAYRKLLEGEETRIGLKTVVESMIEQREGGSEVSGGGGGSSGGMRGEMSAKTTYQRSAKGNVSIAECSADGRYIILENTGKKDEGLDNWRISRRIDNRVTVNYTLPSNCKLGTGGKSKLKIWAKGAAKQGEKKDDDLESGDKTWGIGANISTSLLNGDGEERATHIQKTVYS